FENKAIELPLETCEHQIISSEDEVQDCDNQQVNLEMKHKFYTRSVEGMGAKMQYNLLKAKFLGEYIEKKDLYNAIQQFRIPSREKLKTDNTKALQQLIALKADDPEWIVIPNIEEQLKNASNQTVPKIIYTDADLAIAFLYDVTEISYDWDNFSLEPEDIWRMGVLKMTMKGIKQ
ncbi:15540_t:CDS:2, partial [Racocetra fulgida]